MSSSTKNEIQEFSLESTTKEKNGYRKLNEIGESMEGKQQEVEATPEPGFKKTKRRKKKGIGAICLNTLGNLNEEDTVQRRPIDIRHSLHKRKEPLQKSTDDEQLQKCLQLERKLLNPEFELRKIFGSKVIDFERGKRSKQRHGQNQLIIPRDTWRPAVNTGISMKFLGPDQNRFIFKFEHNKEYQEVQRRFLKSVTTYDPRNISNIMKAHAYHIDTRIQLSDMAKSTDDMAHAAELIEGALHAMEKSLHLRFNVTFPSCRLPYKYQENRAFFILMFKHLNFLGQRACHRTALELCKRLFTLDTEDPLCVLLLIDFYAIKTEQLQWLVEFCTVLKLSRDLNGYPNLAYSVALAWYLQSLTKKKTGAHSSGLSPQEMVDTADGLLQQAILLYPRVVVPLMEKCAAQIEPRIKNHFYFQKADKPLYELLCSLYVWRCVHLWKTPEVVKWLVKNVTVVMDIVEANDSFKETRYPANAFEDNQINVYRHVLLTDESSISAYLPKEVLSKTNFSFDPLPPADSVDIYTEPKDSGITEQFNDLLQDLNGLEQSLGRDRSVEETAGVSRPTNLQQSVTDLLDAMRDLLRDVNARNEN